MVDSKLFVVLIWVKTGTGISIHPMTMASVIFGWQPILLSWGMRTVSSLTTIISSEQEPLQMM